MILPIFIPQAPHDPEEDKITCPKCKHRFVPESDDDGRCMIPFLLWIAWILCMGVVAALATMDVIDLSITDHISNVLFGLSILGLIGSIISSFALHVLFDI